MKKLIYLFGSAILAFQISSCGTSKPNDEAIFKEIQEKLINAKPGETIELPEGKFSFSKGLTMEGIANITIKGKGPDKTIFSFKDQSEGPQGLGIKADNCTLEGFAIEDAKGDAIKIQNSKNIVVRNVRIGWTEGPKTTNGAYGLYPVTCDGVLIENCDVYGASDAGIYVGQSKNVIVRNNKVHENVAGLEIENTSAADVYENEAYNNTGGIMVFDMPEVPVKNGRDVYVHNNNVHENNLANFGPPGNTVALVPAGMGMLVMAYNNVELTNNKVTNNNTLGICVASFLTSGKEYSDTLYNPYTYAVYIHDNEIKRENALPDTSRMIGKLLAGVFGANIPDIIFDGFYDPAVVNAKTGVAPENRICIKNNGAATFANVDGPNNFKNVSTDIKSFDCALEAVLKPTAEAKN
jgi:parallel beta-helix repeat protein